MGAMIADETAIVPADQGAVFLQLIERLAVDPRVDVTKLAALVELKERIDAKQAEIEFNRDFTAASAEMPHVVKRGVIDMGGKGQIPFARYEDLDRAIRPIETKHGFTRSFLTVPAPDGIVMTVKLAHRAGHSERSTRHMPPDPGPGRNGMQAIGSASSYAKRYLTLDIWNVVTEGQDNDASGAEPLTAQEASNVLDMISASELSQTRVKKLLAFAHAETIEQIQRHRYNEIMAYLKKVLSEKQEKSA